jgi:glycosyltransferase involved in cell wall biosynthesis
MGGATLHALGEARWLQQVGFEVLLVSAPCHPTEMSAEHMLPPIAGISHRSIAGFGRNFDLLQHFFTYRKLRKILKDFDADLVHTHTPVAGVAGRLAAASLQIKAVHTYHGLLFTGYYGRFQSRVLVWVERWLATQSAALVAISYTQKKLLVEQFKVAAPEKVHTIPIGIQVTAYQQEAAAAWRTAFREQFAFAPHEIVVAIVGRLVAIKNHRFFLKMAKEALSKMPNLRFAVIGDGVLKKSLFTEAGKLGLMPVIAPNSSAVADVVFTGWLADMPKAMAGIDILALCSGNEGTPLSIMEAMAAGKPVIATPVGAVPEMVQHGQTGVLVHEAQTDVFANELVALASQPNLQRKLGKAAANWAKQHFDEAQKWEHLVALLEQLMTDKLDNV